MRLTRYWLVVVGIAVAVPVIVALVDVWAGSDDDRIFCTTEGVTGPDGEIYGRSPDHGCQFVDEDGELLRFADDRDPLCYGGHLNQAIVPCDQPGARRPG